MKTIYITLGGEERPLRYDINAVTDIETVFGGRSLLTMLANPAFFSFSLIRAMLWGGLKHRIKGLTLDRTGLMMQEYIEGGGSLQELSVKINEALVEAGIFKEDKDEEPSEGNPPSPAVNTEKK